MMQARSIAAAIVIPLLGLTVTGCAWFHPHHAHVALRTIKPTEDAQSATTDEGLYADAIADINRRDYASALDALETASARDPGDVRVLNAFGVVYDKLGRFDLSTRYYAQAQALDPKSEIIANNLTYSRFLQARQSVASSLASAASPAPITAKQATVASEDLYKQAVAAISTGDNARAIELLTAARTQNGSDVRVLNALGVAYDRLGRFDLSQRYYAQASALDPNSPILANNRDNSRMLQARVGGADPASAARDSAVRIAAASPAPSSAR